MDYGKQSLSLKRKTIARTRRLFDKVFKRYLDQSKHGLSDRSIVLFTPLVEKDLSAFRYSAEYARKNLLHKIEAHYVIGPDSLSIRKACRELNCTYVDESSVIDLELKRIRNLYPERLKARAGWLFQQFLKLGSDMVCEGHPNILILDADTIFSTPSRFHWKNQWLLDYTNEYHSGYDNFASVFLGLKNISYISFVSHYMLMESAKLKSLRNDIEKKFGMYWIEAILNNIDFLEIRNFSEYQLYANYVLKKSRREHRLGYWFNQGFDVKELNSEMIASYTDKVKGKYKSISFHTVVN